MPFLFGYGNKSYKNAASSKALAAKDMVAQDPSGQNIPESIGGHGDDGGDNGSISSRGTSSTIGYR